MSGKEFLTSLQPYQTFGVMPLDTLVNNRAIWLPALERLCVSPAASQLLADADTSQEALFNLEVTMLSETVQEPPYRVRLGES